MGVEQRSDAARGEDEAKATTFQSLPSEPVARTRSRSGEWTPLLLLLPAVCCGAPLLLAAAVALGFGSWFAANRLLVVSALALAAAAIFLALWLRGRRGQLR
jgi:hypothetical protein